MLNQEVVMRLNEQVNAELKNHLFYRGIARLFNNLRLLNLAKYFEGESKGELEHFEKFYNYLRDNHEGIVSVQPHEQQIFTVATLDMIPEAYLKAELTTTLMLTNLMGAARNAQDEKTQAWLQWALEEQIEEENIARQLSYVVAITGNSWAHVDLIYGG